MHNSLSSRLLCTARSVLLLGGLLLFGLVHDRAVAQEPTYEVHPDYLVKHFTVEDGLPVNTTTGLVQARDGYLWMTTWDGLVRFDGERFSVFNTSNSPGLTNNRLHLLHEGEDGALWMLIESGNLIRYQDGIFTAFDQDEGLPGRIRGFHMERDSLWLLTEGGTAYYSKGRVHPFHSAIIKRSEMALRSRSGDLWVGAWSDGVYRVRTAGEIQHFTFPSSDQEPPLDVKALHEDQNGVLWVGLGAGEVGAVYRLQGDQFEPITVAGRPWSQPVTMIDSEPDGTLWFGVYENGWWSYRDGVLKPFPAVEPGIPGPLLKGPDGALWRVQGRWVYRDETPIFHEQLTGLTEASLRFDREGNLWVAGALGLYRLRRRLLRSISEADGLQGRNLYPILEDRQGTIWIGSWGRFVLARFDDGAITNYTLGDACCVTSLYEDQAGTLWVGKLSEPCRMQGERCVSFDPPSVSMQGSGVRAMHEDRHGRFWFGTEHGLFLGHPTEVGRSWTHFTIETGLTSNWVRAIVETREGDVLFGTNGGGIMRYRTDDTLEAFTTADGLASDHVRDLYEDRNGLLWIATEDRGLCRLERRVNRQLQGAGLVCLDIADGLFDNSLHRILEDDYGRFWFNTNRGVFWVEHAELNAFARGDAGSVTSVSYTERDGMRNREGNGGIQPAGIKASDGRLWFPTQDGAVVIDPSQVQHPEAPPVVIETVIVNDETQRANGKLVLAAGERDLDIAYTALVFSRPEDVRFRYMLEGYDEDWNDVGDRRVATYTNLPPGQYTFRVKAGLGGAWSEEGASMTLERRPFFWETTWFYGLVALLFAFAGPSTYVYRIRRMKARQDVLEQTVAARTAQIREHETQLEQQADDLHRANELKSRFLANISHEFRTPLTLTFGPLNDLLSGRHHSIDEARPHLERARRSGQRLLRLINQLLDLSKLDAGNLTLHLRRHDLIIFLKQRMAAFEALAADRRLTLRFLPDIATLPFFFDAEKLETVVLNLLSNAFKFTPEGGTIFVAVRRAEDGATAITVRDTGEGIPSAHLPYLFDRFYQVDGSTTRAREGTGIGLALVRQLVDLHGGTITVDSTVGVGTTFTVTLPEPTASGDGVAVPDERATIALPAPTTPTLSNVVLADLHAHAAPLPTSDDAVDDQAVVVLVVEDNADMRAYIRAHLDGRYHVEEAENGAVGLARAVDLVPDLVLSDVMMPEMDGFGLLAALKADERTSHVPVVLLTAKADAESKIAGLKTGADDYLAKPFDAEELRARVDNLIEGRRQLRERWSRQQPLLTFNGLDVPSMEAVFLERVQMIIETQMDDSNFGVDALAEAMGMSPRQLRRKLRSLVDESPNELLRRFRLERAAALLQQAGGSVKEIAFAVGFGSVSRFRAAFREAYGVAPSDYAPAQPSPDART